MAAALAAGASAGEPLEVRLPIRWDYRNLPHGMRVHEYDPKRALPLWAMGDVAAAADLPAGPEIPGGVVRLKPGMNRKLVLVFHNTTKEPLRFFAAPHHLKPAEASLGFEFACLCTNHVYPVEPGRFWYRVVELGLHEDFEGTELEIRHALVRVKGSAIDKTRHLH
ncbi:MAG: hypothetical protein HY925_03515 [Elusimicrobia bacterium]|nr:hypothetical protein [Elusimicrobiota bacterium]